MKLGWAIRSGEEALWIEVLQGNYGRGTSNLAYAEAKVQDSSLWKSLTNTWNLFNLYEFWTIGKGDTVKAWTDKWLFLEKSIQDIGIQVPDDMQNMMV
jgi:hypothetical protein